MSESGTALVAARLGVSQQRVTEMLRAGKLVGRQLGDGRWLVDDSALSAQYLAPSQGRHWTQATSWAILAELSGLPGPLVSSRTRARLRSRLRTEPVEQIALKVASRLRPRRFAADSREATAADLILTGRSATDVVESDLVPQREVVEGYVLEGSLPGFVRKHLLVPDPGGDVTIYEYPGSVTLEGPCAPAAVVAADLARSPSTRERSAGLKALELVRRQWLEAHIL